MATSSDRWKVGEICVTRIVDIEDVWPASIIFRNASDPQIAEVGWLRPHYATADGRLHMSFHAFLVESEGKRILVDTCVGNDKTRLAPFFDHLTTPFIARLEEAGCGVGEIDFVLCTHLHVDHVGWNTRWDGTEWVPTFPNAQYLFGRTEWDFWQAEIMRLSDSDHDDSDVVLADSVMPIIAAGQHHLVEVDHSITSEVRLLSTPGHTPGHVSVVLSSGNSVAIIAGDILHHPVQIADAGIQCNFDVDHSMAEQTRRAFLQAYGDRDVAIFGTHFARPSAGRITRDGKAWRFEPI